MSETISVASATPLSLPSADLRAVCKFDELLDVSRRELDLRKLVEEFETPPSTPDRKEVVDAIRKVLEKDLFIYDRMEIRLPPTVFVRPHHSLAIAALSVPQVSAEKEVQQLAFASDFSAEIPMLRVTRLSTSYSPFLKLHIEGAKNAAWTMRDCHAFVNGEGFWDALKQAYGSFQVSAVRNTLYPVHLNESLLNIAEFNTSSAVDTPVTATLSTNAHVKGALNKLQAHGDPQFEIQLRFRAQESNQQLLLCAFTVRASQLLVADVNLATPSMGERPAAALQPAEQVQQQRRKLSPLQLEQLWQTGQFEVPSKLFPGTSHVWELSNLLLSGARIRNEVLMRVLAFATQQIYGMRRRVSNSSRMLDLRSCLTYVKDGLFDILGCTLGVPVEKRLFGHSAVNELIANERVWHLMNALKLKPTSPEDVKGDSGSDEDWVAVGNKEVVHVREAKRREMIPYVLTSEQDKELCVELSTLKFPYYVERLQTIIEFTERQWRNDRLAVATAEEFKIRAQYSSSSSSSSPSSPSADEKTASSTSVSSSSASILDEKKLLEILQDAMAEEFNRRCFAAIESDVELAKWHPRLPAALSRQLRAGLIIRQEKETMEQNHGKLREAFQANLKAKHPIAFRVASWRDPKMSAFSESLDPYAYVTPALARLDHTSAMILQTNIQFDQQVKPELGTRLSAHMQPSQEFLWRARIWNPQNWRIVHAHNSYRAETDTEHKVSTDRWGWRIRNLVRGTITRFNNFNFVVVACLLLNGPLSLKALLGSKPFTPGKRVNQDKGTLEEDPNSTQQTLSSRISALWKHARNSRNSFEAQADTGLLGKSVTRWFSRFWNWGVVAGVGTVLVATVMPPLCIVSSALCVAAAVLSPVLVPAWMLFRYVYSMLVFDLDFIRDRVDKTWGSRFKSLWFPLIVALLQILLTGLVRPALALIFMLGLHPLLAILAVCVGSIRWLLGYMWDRATYSLLIRPLARVPCENGFLQRRVAGPGVSWTWFNQVSVPEALIALRAHLERTQLSIFEAHVSSIIDAPMAQSRRVLRELFGPFSAYVDPVLPVRGVVGRSHEQHVKQLDYLLTARRLQLPTIKEPQRMRMTEEDLQETVRRGARIVEQFMQEGVFASLSEERIADWWSQQKLAPGSWNELARQFLRAAIAPQFTESLAESDKMFRFATEQVGMSEFLAMVEAAAPRDHLDKVSAVVGRVAQMHSIRELRPEDARSALDDFSLSTYPHPTTLSRSHRVFLRALQGDVPKIKEDDEAERNELASKQNSITTQRR